MSVSSGADVGDESGDVGVPVRGWPFLLLWRIETKVVSVLALASIADRGRTWRLQRKRAKTPRNAARKREFIQQ